MPLAKDVPSLPAAEMLERCRATPPPAPSPEQRLRIIATYVTAVKEDFPELAAVCNSVLAIVNGE